MVAPRKAVTTVRFVDNYCAAYEDIFPEVRSFESFKYLHVGMISEIKRKSLPEIAKVVGLDNEQPLDILKERKSTTWYLMSNLLGDIKQTVGNTYGFRNWIESGLKQGKNELGWANFRGTNYHQIEKWWEIVCCAYLMVSWQALERKRANTTEKENQNIPTITEQEPEVFSRHEWWDFRLGWKSTLNNLRLIIQPYVFFNLLQPWLDIFNIAALENGFLLLRNMMDQFDGYIRLDSG